MTEVAAMSAEATDAQLAADLHVELVRTSGGVVATHIDETPPYCRWLVPLDHRGNTVAATISTPNTLEDLRRLNRDFWAQLLPPVGRAS